MKSLAIAAFMTIAATGAAFAADPPMAPPPVVVAPELYDWTGFYIGGHVGGGWGVIEAEVDPDGPLPPVALPDFDVSGWLAGVQAGGNWQTGRFVLGVEGRVAWSDINGDVTVMPFTTTFDTNWTGSLLGRIGVALGERGRVLPYLVGGVTATGYDIVVTTPGFASTGSTTGVGGSIGAGIEFAVGERVSVFGEYIHTFYGTSAVAIPMNGPIGAATVNVRPSIGTAQVGFNFHF